MVRKKLAQILHRIEYDIDRTENIAALKVFCEKENIFPEYLRDFIHETVIHEESMLRLLAGESLFDL